jgi:hypothetical protein
MPTITTEFSITLQVITANSSIGYGECFKDISRYMKKRSPMVISHIKAKHSADGYTISVFLLCDVKESQ